MFKVDDGRFLDVLGIRTFYIEAGSGPPLILLHGTSPGACSLVNWKLNIEPFAAAGFHVYAYDQPGFGYSDNPADYSVEFSVTHAMEFISKWKLDRFHLLGNSMGGYIAARVALEEPKVAKVVLVASTPLAPPGSPEADAVGKMHSAELREYTPTVANMRNLTFGTVFDKALVTDDLVRERFRMSAGKNFEAQMKRRTAARPRPVYDELWKIQAKTLILWGNNDRGGAVERAYLLFQKIPRAELHIFDRCGHWLQWDQFNRFQRIVVDFLNPAERE